jgi:hypothetical protein
MTDIATSTYRNRYTRRTVTIVNATMRAELLYASTAADYDTYVVTFGLEGRDGTTFSPRHWTRVADVVDPLAGLAAITRDMSTEYATNRA